MKEHAPVLIVVFPIMFAFITPLLGWIRKSLCYPWALLALSLSTIFSIITLERVVTGGVIHYHLGSWLPPWGIEYVVDHLNAMMLVIVSGAALLVAIYSRRSIEVELPGKMVYFYTIFLLQTTGFLGIVITGDMFNLYVFLEIASLAGYTLIAIGEDGAPLASFRYIIMGTVGACFYLLGVGYLYMVTGSLNMADLATIIPLISDSKVVLTAFAFFMAGIAIKMALFPLHVWLPDAYTRAPSTSSALIAPLMTKISVYVMIRIFFTVFKPTFTVDVLPATDILLWLGTIAIFGGAIMALAQTDFKRMLCYIVVAEVGYMVGGIGVANTVAIQGAVLHLLNDAVMTLGLFIVAGIVTYQMKSHLLSDFNALFKKMPLTMVTFVVVALSVIGVPPTCGFFSKWYLLQGGIMAGAWAFVVALLLSSLINVILFFRIFEIGYVFQSGDSHHEHGHEEGAIHEAPASMLLPSVVVALGILAIGIYNQVIINNIITFVVPKL
jgi:multicomponent Na+:H+ antiporter subunit D